MARAGRELLGCDPVEAEETSAGYILMAAAALAWLPGVTVRSRVAGDDHWVRTQTTKARRCR